MLPGWSLQACRHRVRVIMHVQMQGHETETAAVLQVDHGPAELRKSSPADTSSQWQGPFDCCAWLLLTALGGAAGESSVAAAPTWL